MRTLRAVIVDDEPLARTSIRAALASSADVAIVAEFGDGPAAVAGLRRHRPDLVFLDVQMPGLDGFGVLAELAPDDIPAVIFVTAFDQFAIKAFEVHATDYVLKPFDDVRLRRAVDEARTRIESDRLEGFRERLGALLDDVSPVVVRGGPPASARFAKRVLVREGEDHFRFVRLEDVAWIEAAGNNLRLHTAKAVFEIRMTLRALVPQLDPAVFRRIHRSTVVNLNAVLEIQPWFAGDCVVRLHDRTEIRMSRTYRDQLVQPLL